jgi:predicted HicB family RNase H-like nuclease
MTKTLYVRLPDEEHEYIARLAELQGRSINEIVRRLIETARQGTGNNPEMISDNGGLTP